MNSASRTPPAHGPAAGSFAPIAIVGHSCLLPQSLSPEALWHNVLHGRNLLGPAPEGRWRMDPARAMEREGWNHPAGYIEGFEVSFNPSGFDLPEALILQLDPLVQWVLDTGREALQAAVRPGGSRRPRMGAVLGNLSLPSHGLAKWAENHWLRHWPEAPRHDVHPLDRFMSGLPAHLLARALGLDAGVVSIDAACASSLYAIKLACDRLHDRSADLMLAGAVNRADQLFLHIGFQALQALSPTGQSRPFHRQADGLIPSEGAAFVALKRLDDAITHRDQILGVIRGVGLSNDGRADGLLVPSSQGQIRAMAQAYRLAGLSPADVQFVECHATGTAVGDATELASLESVFGDVESVAIGSLKSNLGHTITVAGLAGLIKILGAMEAGIMPAGLHTEAPIEPLANSRFRLLAEPEPWNATKRRAAVSAFGFGGNNSHLIVEQWSEAPQPLAPHPYALGSALAPGVDAAIVAIGLRYGSHQNSGELLEALARGQAQGEAHEIELSLEHLRFPPRDLEQTLPQQLLLLRAAQDAVEALGAASALDPERTGALIGMQTDPAIVRHGLRARLEELLKDSLLDAAQLQELRARIAPALTAPSVVGSLPNIVANRLNAQFDLRAPSFAVSAEEISGNRALELALRALGQGEIDAALVGAVDMACDPIQMAAVQGLLEQASPGAPPLAPKGADAAVVMVVKRLADARRDGDTIYAVLPAQTPETAPEGALCELAMGARLGHAHAAQGIMALAIAALGCRHGFELARDGDLRHPALIPWLSGSPVAAMEVRTQALGEQQLAMRLERPPGPAAGLLLQAPPTLYVWRAFNRAGLHDELLRHPLGMPEVPCAPHLPATLVLVARSAEELARKRQLAERLVNGSQHANALHEGVFLGDRPLTGQLAFCYAGAAAAYQGMGQQLLLAFPQLAQQLGERFGKLREASHWVYQSDPHSLPTPLEKLWGASILAQAHTHLSRDFLGLVPQAALGFSSGETNALYAMGIWNDLDAIYEEFNASGAFTRDLGGEFRLMQRLWPHHSATQNRWENWRVLCEREELDRVLAAEPTVHLTLVQAPGDFGVGGPPAAIARLLERLGSHRATPIHYDILAHTPHLQHYAAQWLRLHRRPTQPAPNGLRLYSHAQATHYTPDEESIAQALLAQATQTVDFPALVQNAYSDGVRIFLEHGPQATLTHWTKRILGNRPHLALSLDTASDGGLDHLATSLAQLVAAGLDVRWQGFNRHLAHVWSTQSGPLAPAVRRMRLLPGHPWDCELAPGTIAPLQAPVEQLSPAPTDATAHAFADPGELQVAEAVAPDHRDIPTPTGPAHRPADSAPSETSKTMADPRQPAPCPMPQAPALPPVLPMYLNVGTARSEASAPAKNISPDTARPLPTHAAAPEPAPEHALAPLTIPAGQHASAPRPSTLTSEAPAPKAPDFPAALAPPSPKHTPPASPPPDTAPSLPHVRPVPTPDLWPSYVAERSRAQQAYLKAMAQQAAIHADYLKRAQRGWQDYLAQSQRPATTAQTLASQGPRAAEVPPQHELFAPEPESLVETEPTTTEPATLQLPEEAVRCGEPHAIATDAAAAEADILPGPKFDRKELEILASGKISRIFGELFAPQDEYHRQVRMPEPPLLLADRVTGIRATPGVLGQGTIWTETDITPASWYLHQGHIPPGVLIEAGQADLLLVSWMGIDFKNRGRRIYRLLGCELTYHQSLPKSGDTLAYDIHIDGHAYQGEVGLFFFHYDCRVQGELCLTVRHGQAGFFTDEELADSRGVLWSAETGEKREDVRLDPPAVPRLPARLSMDQVRDFSEGRTYEAFGPGYELAQTHTRSPRIQSGRMMLLGPVTALEPQGGPWKRGYLRSELALSAHDWFFEGHFKNDPCMPGTLMFEGGLQAMATYMAALGYTLTRDGWRFEPVPQERYKLICRGQATPASRRLVYEIFVEEVLSGPEPTLFADILITVDGLKAFHCRRMGLRLTPAFPLEEMPSLLAEARQSPTPDHVAYTPDGLRLDYRAMLACALGRPSEALGSFYKGFDQGRRMPRLPSPPYHFMTRLVACEGTLGQEKVGTTIAMEYDIPKGAWYFDKNGAVTMPYCVLLEAALQPCGWLSLFVGTPVHEEGELFYRNLDGEGRLHVEVLPQSGTLTTHVTMTRCARSGGMIIQGFEVRCMIGATLVYTMQTVFGFFPKHALENQKGLAATPKELAWLDEPANMRLDLTTGDARYFGGSLRLADPMLRMIDHITGFWPTGGEQGLGRLRAEKDVHPDAWFFKAHFFQDPVQPGSLGIEAMLQTLQFFMLQTDMGQGFEEPRFEPIALLQTMSWKYRGQVLPHHKRVVVEMDITSRTRDARSALATARAWLWVDGLRIYEAQNIAMRIVEGA